MLVESKTPDTTIIAKERVRIEPVPAWVTPCPFDINYRPKKTEQITTVFFSQQVHAELRQMHVHTAARLETMQAVQHHSQWRLQFEPRIQTVNLHWIRIHRGETVTEHAHLEKIRLLQRAEGLEGFIINGWLTLLLVLEDVRPGDILESCYTIETQPTLLPEFCTFFYSLPLKIPVGKFHFSLRFNESRPMRWKSSSPDLRPVEKRESGQAYWVWTDENVAAIEPEANTPAWLIDSKWVQISDCSEWEKVAAAVSNAWKEEADDPLLAEIVRGFVIEEPALEGLEDKQAELLVRVEKALRLVQDEFRYLSVDLEVGGHVPAPPGTVARRRYGDCKDLSFVLVHLLKLLGVPARPVLVNTRLRKTIAKMLPTPALFNHVVVEYQLEGQTRWVDPTMNQQGGGPLDRSIPDYGVGLPIGYGSGFAEPARAQNESGLFELSGKESLWLVEAPPIRAEASSFELRESLLLDTTGKGSLLAVTVIARGSSAEGLRQQLEAQGKDAFEKGRLQLSANRYSQARRTSPLEYRDDRSANEFVLVELFEVNGFLTTHGTSKACRLSLPKNIVISTLPLPEKLSRRNPFALPYPCNLVHVVEVQSAALGIVNRPNHKIESPFLRFDCTHNTTKGYWSMTLRLSTLVDSVPPDRMSIYDRTVREIKDQFDWHLLAELGFRQPQRRADFGKLPATSQAASGGSALANRKPAGPVEASGHTQVRAGDPVFSGTPVKSSEAAIQSAYPRQRPRHHHHSRRRKGSSWLWPAIIGLIALAFVSLLIYMVWQSYH